MLGVLVLVGMAIRSQHLTSPFFYDEAVYVNLAQHPFHSDFYPDPVFFRHPPAHHLLLAAWGRMVGYGEIAMRLPSLLFAAATVVLTYLLGLRVLAQKAALAAAALLAFSVLHQQYAQAATMYAMATFFVTLCVYGLVSGDERLVAGGFIGAIYVHYFGFYLAPSVLLFYVRRYDGNWRRIAARVALYVAAYSPWIAVGLEGMAFHSNRGHELLGWDFHWLNLLRQLSAALLAGSLCLLFVQRRRRDLQPALLLCAVFLLSAPLLAVWLIGVCLPNVEAYGVYPAMGRYLDLRDAIQLQEWEGVIAAVPDGRVATANARSLIFYGNLKGARAYEVVEQFDDNPTRFARLVEGGVNDWIVLSKYPPYAALIPIVARSTRYQRVAEFDATVVYEKVDR